MSWGDVLPPTASLIEAVWTLSTAFGVLVSAVGAGITTTNLRAAVRADRRACSTVPVNALHTAITGHAVRNEALSVVVLALLLLVLALFVAIGVVALATPEPVRAELRAADAMTAAVLVAGAVVATVATALLTAGSMLNRRDRHRLTNRITSRLLAEQLARHLAQRTEARP